MLIIQSHCATSCIIMDWMTWTSFLSELFFSSLFLKTDNSIKSAIKPINSIHINMKDERYLQNTKRNQFYGKYVQWNIWVSVVHSEQSRWYGDTSYFDVKGHKFYGIAIFHRCEWKSIILHIIIFVPIHSFAVQFRFVNIFCLVLKSCKNKCKIY